MIFEPRFIFRGNAFGIGGHIREPYFPHFEVQAASSLPTVGGLSKSEAKGASFGKLFSFGNARTMASGGVRPTLFHAGTPNNTTLVQSEVYDMLVEGRFHVHRQSMALRSHANPEDEQPSVVPEETEIEGVTLDSCKVDVILETDPFRESPTKKDLRNTYKAKPEFRKQYQSRFFRPPNAKGPEDELYESKGLIFATIVKQIIVHHDEKKCKNHQGKLEVKDNLIIVPNFGKVFFGELIIGDHYRRLSAIRMELGSPMKASIESGGVDSNGSWGP